MQRAFNDNRKTVPNDERLFQVTMAMTNRQMKEEGLEPIFGYILGLTVLLLLSAYGFQKTAYAKYLVILSCLIFQLKLSATNRTEFLRLTFGDKVKKHCGLLKI
jgi:hypothetical protein